MNGVLIATVRQTSIDVGGARGLLLGPLVVDPLYKGLGYGKALMRHAVAKAADAGCRSSCWWATSPITGPSASSRCRRGGFGCRGRSIPPAFSPPS